MAAPGAPAPSRDRVQGLWPHDRHGAVEPGRGHPEPQARAAGRPLGRPVRGRRVGGARARMAGGARRFGWRDGRLATAGAHDDLVLATWLLERGVRFALDLLAGAPREEIV